MPNPHSHGKYSESNFILSNRLFLQTPSKVTRLRVILKQPSPHWDDHGITNFSVHSFYPNSDSISNDSVITERVSLYEIELLN